MYIVLTFVDAVKSHTEQNITCPLSRYAYTGRPVVVTDGTISWPGREVFSFQFFKQLYNQSQEQACQFFPYETEFRSLREVFDMREDRALMQDNTKPWYIGWYVNCPTLSGLCFTL